MSSDGFKRTLHSQKKGRRPGEKKGTTAGLIVQLVTMMPQIESSFPFTDDLSDSAHMCELCDFEDTH